MECLNCGAFIPACPATGYQNDFCCQHCEAEFDEDAARIEAEQREDGTWEDNR